MTLCIPIKLTYILQHCHPQDLVYRYRVLVAFKQRPLLKLPSFSRGMTFVRLKQIFYIARHHFTTVLAIMSYYYNSRIDHLASRELVSSLETRQEQSTTG